MVPVSSCSVESDLVCCSLAPFTGAEGDHIKDLSLHVAHFGTRPTN